MSNMYVWVLHCCSTKGNDYISIFDSYEKAQKAFDETVTDTIAKYGEDAVIEHLDCYFSYTFGTYNGSVYIEMKGVK